MCLKYPLKVRGIRADTRGMTNTETHISTGNSNAVFVRSGAAAANDRRRENRFSGTVAFSDTAAEIVAAARLLCPEIYS